LTLPRAGRLAERTPGRTAALKNARGLFQRRIYRSEFGVERAAESIYGGNDHNTEARRDQAIFNGRRAGFVADES